MSFLCTGVKAWYMGAQFMCWLFFPFVEQMCPVISPPPPPTLVLPPREVHPGKRKVSSHTSEISQGFPSASLVQIFKTQFYSLGA